MHPQPAIRPARSEDAAIAAEISVDSSNTAFRAWRPPMEADEARASRWRIDLAEASYRWWIAEVNGRAVGLAGIGPSRDPEGEGIGELDTIAVRPTWWRHGIGRALMAVANHHLDLDGYDRAVLWTWADYPAAAALLPIRWLDPDRNLPGRRPTGLLLEDAIALAGLMCAPVSPPILCCRTLILGLATME